MLHLTPLEWLDRVAALIPPAAPSPAPLSRGAGSQCQAVIAVPTYPWSGRLRGARTRSGPQPLQRARRSRPSRPTRYLWAMLLARVYEVFPLLCPRCGEAMTLIGFMTDRGSIQRILEHLGELTRPTPIASARGPPHGELDFDQREVDAFALSDPLPVYEFAQRVSW